MRCGEDATVLNLSADVLCATQKQLSTSRVIEIRWFGVRLTGLGLTTIGSSALLIFRPGQFAPQTMQAHHMFCSSGRTLGSPNQA
eukprot:m.119593 g.119593  ORF g.119593 m.119593 type:complete len:85 (+) comp13299_c0_seq3:289-543(+)